MKYVLSLILFNFASLLFSQNINGTVVSENVVLDGVRITIKGNKTPPILTKLDGTFSIHGLQSQKYILVLERLGFISKEEVIDLRKKNEVQVAIEMIPDLKLFEEVAVVGKSVGLTEKTPYTISRLDAKNVALKGQPSGVMGLLQQEPGVNGAEMGQGIVKPFIRGLGFNRVVTIYQGGKLENHQWGADHGLGLNDLGIGSIDVIKGPASILYGSGAIGGVLILNDDEFYTLDNSIRGMFGTTYNSVSQGFRGYGTLGKKWENGVFFAIEGAYENHADYLDGNNRIIGNSRFNLATSRVHLGFKGEKMNNKITYAFNNQALGIIDDNEMTDGGSLATTRSDRKTQLPFQKVTDHLISYRQDYTFNRSWKSELDITYHFNQREEIEDDFNEIDLGLLQDHLFYNLRFQNNIKDQYVQKFGVQGSYVNLRNMIISKEVLFPNAEYFENGLYYLGTYTNGRHTIQGGLRTDYRPMRAFADQSNIVAQGYVLPGNPEEQRLDLSFFGWTGSLGYTFEINEQNLVKLNTSSGFRSPDLAELLSNGPHPGTNRFEVGNIDFGNEQSFQGDISWLYAGKNLNIQTSLFSNIVNNYIFFTDSGDTTANGLNIWEFQQTDALLYGAEVNVSYEPLQNNQLKIDLFGNVIRGQDLLNSENLTFIPADRIGAQITLAPFNQLDLSLFIKNQYVFAQNRPGFGEEQTNGYNLMHFGTSYKFKIREHRVNIGLTVFNLLNQTYFDHISILRAFEVNAPGRNVMLNLQWRF